MCRVHHIIQRSPVLGWIMWWLLLQLGRYPQHPVNPSSSTTPSTMSTKSRIDFRVSLISTRTSLKFYINIRKSRNRLKMWVAIYVYSQALRILFLPSVEDGILNCNHCTYNIPYQYCIIELGLFFFILTCSQASEMVYKVIRLWRWHIMQSRFEDLSSAVCRRWRIIQLFLFFFCHIEHRWEMAWLELVGLSSLICDDSICPCRQQTAIYDLSSLNEDVVKGILTDFKLFCIT